MIMTHEILADEGEVDCFGVRGAGRMDLPCEIVEEFRALRHALRESRERLHRSALESARRICALTSEVDRLEKLNAACRQRLDVPDGGGPVAEMSRRLARYREENEALRKEACRAGMLDKALRDAHAECMRMAVERDRLAEELVSTLRRGSIS